jgi:hypothetical protein
MPSSFIAASELGGGVIASTVKRPSGPMSSSVIWSLQALSHREKRCG